MSDPIVFESASPRLGLPYLFVGQAQKEAFVNEALTLLDGIVHCAIEGEQAAPPATPTDGTAWLIGATPSGDWADHAGKIAIRQAGQWLYVTPRDGMRLLNRASGQDARRVGGAWQAPAAPALPAGGSTVDAEARSAFANLVQALRQAGIFPA